MLRRKQKVIKISSRRKGKSVRFDNRMMTIAIVIAALIGVLLTLVPNAYQISIDGTVVGAIKDKKVIENAKKNVIVQLEGEYKTPVKFEKELEVKWYRAKKKDYINPEYLVTYMRKNMDILIQFKQIVVDGKVIGTVTSEDQVEQLKRELKKKYYGDQEVEVDFDKDVKVEDVFAKESDLTSIDKLVEICTATTPKTVTYTVKSGDTLYGIALQLGITVESLINANEGFTDKTTLRVGGQLQANVYEPLLPLRIIKDEAPTETNQLEKTS